jgi:mono/diheme cytochrome c family protein
MLLPVRHTIVRPNLRPLFAARVVFALAISATSALAAAPAPQIPVKPTAASQAHTKKLYSQDCALCHGDSGNGKSDLADSMKLTLADWTDPKSLAALSDQETFDVIRKGKGDKMPPEEASRAKDDDIWNLVIYIRSFSKGHPAAAAAAPGTR